MKEYIKQEIVKVYNSRLQPSIQFKLQTVIDFDGNRTHKLFKHNLNNLHTEELDGEYLNIAYDIKKDTYSLIEFVYQYDNYLLTKNAVRLFDKLTEVE